MLPLPKLSPGDSVAIVSPSFAAPGRWPQVYELGLSRLRQEFGLNPIAFPTTSKIGASVAERAADLAAAFSDSSIKAVVATLGGNDQVTYIQRLLPPGSFVAQPKPFFGFSDNSHLCNWLFLQGVPSFYGGCLFTQFALQGSMDAFTVSYLRAAFFGSGERELLPSSVRNDIGHDWSDPSLLQTRRTYEPNEGWSWYGGYGTTEGLLWGGCLESVDELLRHGAAIPTLDQFAGIVLMLETSEEIPSADYVYRVVRALGCRGILGQVRAVLVGRPQAWDFGRPLSAEERRNYREEQRACLLRAVREYTTTIPVVQNLDFGHTNPQIAMPYGGLIRIDSTARRMWARF